MQDNIHPKYKPFTLVLPDGTRFTTMSSCAEDELMLDVDYRTHPAWTGSLNRTLNQGAANIQKFNKKFAAFGSMLASNAEEDSNS
ncbi:MAG: 50S ribosomal protein L31 [Alphaproteobacteria bacterium]